MKTASFSILFFILLISTISLAQSSLNNAIDFDGDGDYANTLNDPFFPTVQQLRSSPHLSGEPPGSPR